jgi:thiosulfate dehydrogenase [quinone] large subunit
VRWPLRPRARAAPPTAGGRASCTTSSYPNASWIAKFIAIAEFAIGIFLILGLLTGLAALGGVALNLIYMLSGTAGVNPVYAFVGVFLVLAWRNAGYLGLDHWVIPWLRHLVHRGHPAEEPAIEPPVGAVTT